jgi:hypothetical protein
MSSRARATSGRSTSPRRRAEAAREADARLLVRRLATLGLRGIRGVHVHENRTVLVSLAKRRVLRVHRGYAYAADRVLQAIVRFVHPRSTPHERRRAEQLIVGFPVERYVPLRPRRPRPERGTPGDDRVLAELRRRHRRLNRLHFGGRLGAVRIKLSARMETRLGELEAKPYGRPRIEITIGRRHLARDGWSEVEHTLLHEMVHQWQVETGHEPDHGEAFRRKAVEVGIAPRARRMVQPGRRAARRNRAARETT